MAWLRSGLLRVVGAGAAGYVAGLLPSAELVARGVDPRRAGSGNPGAANVAALVGRRAGAVVFTLDMGKAAVAGRVGAAMAGPVGSNVAASAAVLGHCFPATREFRGGKGVASSFGQMLVTFPAYLPVDLLLGYVVATTTFWKQRPVASVGAICGLWTGLATVSARLGLPNLWAPRGVAAMPVAAAVSSAAIVYRFAAEADRQPPPAPPTPESADAQELSIDG